MKVLNIIVLILVIIGAINWGLVGIFQFDLSAAIFSEMSIFSRILYAIIGISGVYSLAFLGKNPKQK